MKPSILVQKIVRVCKRVFAPKKSLKRPYETPFAPDANSDAQRTFLSAKDFERATGIKIVPDDRANGLFYVSLPAVAATCGPDGGSVQHSRSNSWASEKLEDGNREFTVTLKIRKNQLAPNPDQKEDSITPTTCKANPEPELHSDSTKGNGDLVHTAVASLTGSSAVPANDVQARRQSSKKGHSRSASTPGLASFALDSARGRGGSTESAGTASANPSPPLTPLSTVKKGRFIVYHQSSGGYYRQVTPSSAPVSEEEDEGLQKEPIASRDTRKLKESVAPLQKPSEPLHNHRHSICYQIFSAKKFALPALQKGLEYETLPANSISTKLPASLVNLSPKLGPASSPLTSPNASDLSTTVTPPDLSSPLRVSVTLPKGAKLQQQQALRFPTPLPHAAQECNGGEVTKPSHRRQRSRFTILSEEETKKQVVDAFQTYRPQWTAQKIE